MQKLVGKVGEVVVVERKVMSSGIGDFHI